MVPKGSARECRGGGAGDQSAAPRGGFSRAGARAPMRGYRRGGRGGEMLFCLLPGSAERGQAASAYARCARGLVEFIPLGSAAQLWLRSECLNRRRRLSLCFAFESGAGRRAHLPVTPPANPHPPKPPPSLPPSASFPSASSASSSLRRPRLPCRLSSPVVL